MHVKSATDEIVAWGAAEIARRVAAREVSAVEVAAAFIRRIEAAQPAINALVCPLFEAALNDARRADEELARGDALGPLHGVPFTVKECFHVTGTPATLGVERLKSNIAAADGPLVRRWKEAGGILLGKTNVSQLMLFYESDNPFFGRTNNPWDVSRSPGGSTGGEAALIAARGSPLGLGTDLGGSIRHPAHSCGIHGCLPTPGRLTTTGMQSNLAGCEAFIVQPGVLARRVEDLELGLRVMCGGPGIAGAFDGKSPADVPIPVPWRDPAQVPVDRLRIAVWEDDGFMPASPALRRAVREAAAALRAQGATVEQFTPPDAGEAVGLFFGLLSADGGANFRTLLGRSPRDPRIARLLRLGNLPPALHGLVVALARWRGKHRLADLVAACRARSTAEYQALIERKRAFVERFCARLREGRFDAMLCPPHALPALLHGCGDHVPHAASYSILMNVLGLPCGVVAATRVRPGEESDRSDSSDPAEQAAQEVERGSAGLPVGVQIASWPWREDVVLALFKALETHFQVQTDYPTALQPLPT